MREIQKFPWLTGGLVAMAVLASVIPAMDWVLVFDRRAIANGQWWRLLTGNLVHFTPSHLLADVVGFGVPGVLLESRGRWRWIALCGCSALAVGLTVWWGAPAVMQYGGLSGITFALVGYLVVLGIFRSHAARWVWWTGAGLVVVKVVGECAGGVPWFVASRTDLLVLPAVHGVGLAIGVLGALFFGVFRDLSDRMIHA